MTRTGIPIFRKNLLRNSSFELGAGPANNWNGGTLVDIGTATPADGTKVLQSTSDFETIVSNELIEVDPTKKYIIRGWLRKISGGTAAHYFGVSCYDAAGRPITPADTNANFSTQTTLAADVHPTDTTITLTSATGWITSVSAHCVFNTQVDGSDLPNRSQSSSISSIVGNVLHLSGTAGYSYPAGTRVRMHLDSGTFTYAGSSGAITPASWTEFVGALNGTQSAFEGDNTNKFRPGTKYVKVIILFNYGVSGTVTQADAIQFYQEEQAGAQSQSELVHLVEMEFSDGTIRMCTAAADLITEPYAVRIGATTSRYLIRNPIPATWPTTSATIEFWGKLNAPLDGVGHPGHRAVDYMTPTTVKALAAGLTFSSGAWKQFLVVNGTLLVAPATGLSTVPNDQAWHHYLFTWRSSDGQAKMYRDGALIFTNTVGIGVTIAGGGGLVVGQNQVGGVGIGFDSTLSWNGDLDDVRVYSRALSAAEAADHYNRRFANEAGICVNYRFDTPYQLGRDSSLNAAHAKSVGMTAPVVVTGADLVAKTWQAVGGNLAIGGVQETFDTKGQGLELSIDGVDQTVLAALLDTQWRGRPVRLFRGHFDFELGGIATDLMLLFKGYQLSAYTVEENLDRGGGSVSIKTRIAGYFSLDRTAGIQSNLVSHQHYFPTDTFFQNVTQLANTKIYWGTPVPQTPGRGGNGGQSSGPGSNGTEFSI